MTISCTAISDLHGSFPDLPGGDLLILAGDYTASHTVREWGAWLNWLKAQKYDCKIVIGGNHDDFLEHCLTSEDWDSVFDGIVDDDVIKDDTFVYLKDTSHTYKGIKIYGSPWHKTFEGQNPKAMAFGLDTDLEMKEKWIMIPEDVDILVTHTPPNGILDASWKGWRFGCPELRKSVARVRPRYHVYGHIHTFGEALLDGIQYYNVAHMNEDYEPIKQLREFEI